MEVYTVRLLAKFFIFIQKSDIKFQPAFCDESTQKVSEQYFFHFYFDGISLFDFLKNNIPEFFRVVSLRKQIISELDAEFNKCFVRVLQTFLRHYFYLGFQM